MTKVDKVFTTITDKLFTLILQGKDQEKHEQNEELAKMTDFIKQFTELLEKLKSGKAN